MTNQITFEQLAQKLNGKVWIKGDMKRIYLDRGHNTKKMSTKTYVYQNEDGTFGVSCYIDCPSQPYQWIESQKQEVIEGVLQDIENIIAISKLTLVDHKVVTEGTPQVMVCVKSEENEPVWYTEQSFFDSFGEYPENVFEGLPTLTPVSDGNSEG